MNTQMIICMVIFAATLVSYMLNKIPMWLTAPSFIFSTP